MSNRVFHEARMNNMKARTWNASALRALTHYGKQNIDATAD